jgi:DNA-binding GntR family transcriptional regulator
LRAPRRAKALGPVDSQAIVERIAEAIGSHRLAPGTKLGEEALGEIFGVSRTKVRQALFRLASDKLITLVPGRGAFVAQPSVREAREVFEARRAVEGAVVARFVEHAGERELKLLREHIAEQKHALDAGAVNQRNRLLGEFHSVLARLAGNEVMAELVEELVARTSLITLFYQGTRGATESFDEHVVFMQALEAREPARAVALMQEHLSDVERGLVLREEAPPASDLKAALT